MKAIQPAQFIQWLDQANAEVAPGTLPLVLDVREPWEFQTASVRPDGFELLQIPMRTIPARYLELDRQRPIACLCHHGARSAQVVHFLTEQGFTNVVNVHGGIHAWSQDKDPSVPVY